MLVLGFIRVDAGTWSVAAVLLRRVRGSPFSLVVISQCRELSSWMSLPVVLPVCDSVCGARGVVRRAGESGAVRRRLSRKQSWCACGCARTGDSEATVGFFGASASEPAAVVASWSLPPISDTAAGCGVFAGPSAAAEAPVEAGASRSW